MHGVVWAWTVPGDEPIYVRIAEWQRDVHGRFVAVVPMRSELALA